ncbi:YcaO-like family protein [Burkholderia gladioli]|uniref:YcaO-like family protein n=2 Tax=Burkholderia gladioli TaxID=28095 RepID=UPI003132F82B
MPYEVEIQGNPLSAALPPLAICQCQHAPGCAWGTGPSENTRTLTAYAEAVERDVMYSLREDLVAPYSPHISFISPTRFGHPEPSHDAVEWVYFVDDNNDSVLIHRPTRLSTRPAMYRHTSNGIAVHVTRAQAYDAAVMEVFERHWLVDFWEQRVNPVAVAEPESDAVRNVKSAGWNPIFLVLARCPFVAMCILQADETIPPPRSGGVCVGAKAHHELQSACLGAFFEALQLAEGVSSSVSLETLTTSAKYFFNGNGRRQLLARVAAADGLMDTLPSNGSITDARIYRREIELDDFFYCEVQISGLNSYPPGRLSGGYFLPL